ncbi:MAG TPA: 4-hydroxy-3-methylbut-2-enyl diphosphate reductase [Pirellulales bacterium]|nr:4-hydroxy-3-methylbut-2-enyl diphosphate reductase [Pirellulales bacterium]
MQVIRAEAMGFCFGVRDAIEVAKSVERPDRVTIHGELVHNAGVLAGLKARGFQMTAEDDRQGPPATPLVLITAHGVSQRTRERLAAAGSRLIDTTCPLVVRVHRAAQTLAGEGRHVLVIGRPGHVEVRGIVEDLDSFDVVSSPDEVRQYPHAKLGVVCQSTTPPRVAEAVLAAIRRENPTADVRFVDTVCQPTRDRQEAVERLADQVEAMVVVGGNNSNNTRELVALCRERGLATWHVQSAAELDPAWFRGRHVVGLTAGTSTPPAPIDDVYAALVGMKDEGWQEAGEEGKRGLGK